MDVLAKKEELGVGFERRELVVADVYCLYASVGHKSAVGALRLIMLLGANSKTPECGNLDTQLELRRDFLPGMATKPAFTANFTNGAGPGPLRLVPDHFGDAAPDVAAVIRQTSLAFAAGDEHNDYYLNECLALTEWASQHGYVLLRLPAVRGSRQSVNVKLATAILANVSVCLKYDDQVRIDGDPSKLICSQWDGLHSRYVAGALKARSLVDVAFCQPLTFFTHHVTVTRPMIRSIMDCGEAWLLEVQQLGHTGRTRPPALDAIAQRVLAQFPELRPGYDVWWANKRVELEAAYLIATDAAGWAMPRAHLCDAAPFMLATHRRNLDEDAAGVPELEHAPKTSDKSRVALRFWIAPWCSARARTRSSAWRRRAFSRSSTHRRPRRAWPRPRS